MPIFTETFVPISVSYPYKSYPLNRRVWVKIGINTTSANPMLKRLFKAGSETKWCLGVRMTHQTMQAAYIGT